NLSGFSNTANGTTPAAPDTTAPTVPGSFTATAASATRINLAWTASTDNVGVTGYLVEKCQGAGCSNFAALATVTTGTTYADTGLAAGTTFSYRVRARDGADGAERSGRDDDSQLARRPRLERIDGQRRRHRVFARAVHGLRLHELG